MEQLNLLTQSFCQAHLNEEYEQLCVKLIAKMSRKKQVPFISGKMEIWAASIIHALGKINFLFGKTTKPFTSVKTICDFFNIVQSTTTEKSRWIQKTFKLSYYDAEFSTSDIAKRNPYANLVNLNGFVVSLISLEEYKRSREE